MVQKFYNKNRFFSVIFFLYEAQVLREAELFTVRGTVCEDMWGRERLTLDLNKLTLY